MLDFYYDRDGSPLDLPYERRGPPMPHHFREPRLPPPLLPHPADVPHDLRHTPPHDWGAGDRDRRSPPPDLRSPPPVTRESVSPHHDRRSPSSYHYGQGNSPSDPDRRGHLYHGSHPREFMGKLYYWLILYHYT